MGKTSHSIEVDAPVRVVYNQWTQFEEFPNFMEGVEEVRQEDPTTLLWKVIILGKAKEWKARITEQLPDTKIAWQTVDGLPNAGEVNFEALDAERTRITLSMEYEPEGLLEKAGDVLGIPSSRVEGDLKRFRDFIEARGSASGGWRGTIEGKGKVTSTPDPEEGSPLGEEPADLKPATLKDPESDPDKAVAAPTHQEIELRAYELHLRRGQAEGNDWGDWFEAEKQLSGRATSKSQER